jgi:hypothetical protein
VYLELAVALLKLRLALLQLGRFLVELCADLCVLHA